MASPKREFNLVELQVWHWCPRRYLMEYIEKPPLPMSEREAFSSAKICADIACIRENLTREQHLELALEYYHDLMSMTNYRGVNTACTQFMMRTQIGIFHNVHKPYLPPFPWPGPEREQLLLDDYVVNYEIFSVQGYRYIVLRDQRLSRRISLEANMVALADTEREIWELQTSGYIVRDKFSEYKSRQFRMYTKELLRDIIRGINGGFFGRCGNRDEQCNKLSCRYFTLCRRESKKVVKRRKYVRHIPCVARSRTYGPGHSDSSRPGHDGLLERPAEPDAGSQAPGNGDAGRNAGESAGGEVREGN